MFCAYRLTEYLELIHLKVVDDSTAVLTKKKFLDAISLIIPANIVFKSPSNEDVFMDLYKMACQVKLKSLANFKKGKLPTIWQFLCHYIIWSLSGRIVSKDAMGKQLLHILWSIFIGELVDYGTIL